MEKSEKEFAGKTAIVTGAARGIGEAAAKALAAVGAKVVVNDIQDGTQVAREIVAAGGEAHFVPGDVAKFEDMARLVDEAVRVFGGVDILVANAALHIRGDFWEQPFEDARRTVEVTLWGPYNAIRAVARRMIEQGRGGAMVVLGSPHSEIPVPRCMAYNMAKGGVRQLALTAAAELLPYKIRVNIVRPGWTNTPGERAFFSEEEIASKSKQLPAGRMARPDEIARVIVFLASEGSEYINGTTYTVDGGLHLPKQNIV